MALCWILLLRAHPAPGAGSHPLLLPQPHPPDGVGLLLAFSMWMVMMMAMMLPAVLPWVLLFASTSRTRDPGVGPHFPAALFLGGYFAIWAPYCLAAAVGQRLLQRTGALSAELHVGSLAGGVLLVAAGLFQLTPLKAACLKHCRTPLGFFLTRWRDGPSGAFGMGLRHGLFCRGCCWALMGLSFALGLMNLLWMAILTLVLCAEKIAPGGQAVSRAFGLVLGAWGFWLLTTATAP